jgi:hypothetical protein
VTSAPADASASYAAEVARLLWPEPWQPPYVTHARHRPGSPHRDAYLFPSERRPRLLVPADLPDSSSMLQRLGSGRSALSVPVRTLLERSVRSRVFPLARWPMLRVTGNDPGADSIETYLAGCLGTDVRVGVLLGTRRVNQKPVLQVFATDGTLLGYAKVGHNDLTAALVRREADALVTLGEADPRSFRIPRLIHHGRWAGLEVLVMSALTTDPRCRVDPATRLAAMREVVGLLGTTTVPLAGSGFWSRLRSSAQLLADTPDGPRLQVAAGAIERRDGAEQVTFGGWHGDWGRWNLGMSPDDDALRLWDWERYDPAVPVGFDALHLAAQAVRPGQRGAPRQEYAFLRSAPELLSELTVPARLHDLTLRLYLLTIGVRYVEALTHGATPALRRRTAWVLSLLERRSHDLPATRSEGRP